jgi:hypothetical protein
MVLFHLTWFQLIILFIHIFLFLIQGLHISIWIPELHQKNYIVLIKTTSLLFAISEVEIIIQIASNS